VGHIQDISTERGEAGGGNGMVSQYLVNPIISKIGRITVGIQVLYEIHIIVLFSFRLVNALKGTTS
jgi:hypothetical protein